MLWIHFREQSQALIQTGTSYSCGFYCITNSGISWSLDFFIQVGSHRQTSLTKCSVFPGESFSACRPSGHVSSMQQLLIFQLLTLGTLWLQDAPPSRPGLLPISAPSTWRLLEPENGLHHRTAGTVLSLGSQEGLYSLDIWGWLLGESPEPGSPTCAAAATSGHTWKKLQLLLGLGFCGP